MTFTFTLTPAGMHLRVEQTGFRPDQQQAYQGAKYGWQKFFAVFWSRCWRALSDDCPSCHCEERSDEAIQTSPPDWIASLRSQ